jgi:choline/glycine/proline betaine transport protein
VSRGRTVRQFVVGTLVAPTLVGILWMGVSGNIYFVTSSDSGSLVVDLLSSSGKVQPPTRQRLFWAVLEGAVAVTLVFAGGLDALRTASVTTAAPFSVLLALMCVALVKGLKEELDAQTPRRRLRDVESPHAMLLERSDSGAG